MPGIFSNLLDIPERGLRLPSGATEARTAMPREFLRSLNPYRFHVNPAYDHIERDAASAANSELATPQPQPSQGDASSPGPDVKKEPIKISHAVIQLQ